MKKYVFKRLCIAVVTVFVILFVLFLMLELMPEEVLRSIKLLRQQRQEIHIWHHLMVVFLILVSIR